MVDGATAGAQQVMQANMLRQLRHPAWRAKVLAETEKLHVDEAAAQMNQRKLKAAFDAGLKIGFGTDSGATPLRIAGFAEHREL